MITTISIEQVLLVKKTWKIFRAIDPAIVGDTFFSKLFSDNPSLRRMFPRNKTEQYHMLMDTLNTLIAQLEKPEAFGATLRELALRNAASGVRPGHYRLVGDALTWTLRQGLGSDWTFAISKAWADCYAMITGAMVPYSVPDGKST